MTTETMTVHKALAELKIIGDRIESAILNGTFCKTNKHSNDKIKGVSIKEFEGQVQGDWDKSHDLIKRRNAIKKAVILSNALTQVKIHEDEMTRAEAIEMKNTGIYYKEVLLDKLKDQYSKAIQQMDRDNGETLSQRADNYIQSMYGNKDKMDSEQVEKDKKLFIANNTIELIDPIKIKDKIDSLEEEIANFKSEVDACLSVSNAMTEITIEY